MKKIKLTIGITLIILNLLSIVLVVGFFIAG